jgi:DNA-binding XRE family transcriptional regulator
MKASKKALLEANGWQAITVTDLLGLTPQEEAYIEMKLFLAECVKKKRKQEQLTQTTLAETIESSQSRVAKIEKGDPTVSIDLQIKALFSMGVTKKELAKMMLE